MEEKSEEEIESALGLEPDAESSRSLFTQTTDFLNKYLHDLPSEKAYHNSSSAVEKINALSIPSKGRQFQELLNLLAETLPKSGINAAHPGHMGYVPGGGVITTALGDAIASITNEYAGLSFASPAGVAIENQMIDWMKKLMGYPSDAVGHLSSGGSIATLTALISARHWRKVTPENVRKQVIYGTRQIHHCVHKAITIAGLHFAEFREIQMDDQFKMDASDLRQKLSADAANGLQPFIILASAGSTDVGVMDPFASIADCAREHQCWFHVDAAFGGFFMLADSRRSLFQGIERSDSLVMDPHKGLFLAYGSGAVLIKDKSAVLDAMYHRASYMQDAAVHSRVPDPADLSPELTKHFRGLRMWLSLQYFGTDAFAAALEEKLTLTQYFYRSVQKLGYDVGPYPELSACIFRKKTADTLQLQNVENQHVLARIQHDGQVYLSSTTIDGVFWLRICILVFRTHQKHVDQLLTSLEV